MEKKKKNRWSISIKDGQTSEQKNKENKDDELRKCPKCVKDVLRSDLPRNLLKFAAQLNKNLFFPALKTQLLEKEEFLCWVMMQRKDSKFFECLSQFNAKK